MNRRNMDACSSYRSQFGSNRLRDFDPPSENGKFHKQAKGGNYNRKRRGVAKAKTMKTSLDEALKKLTELETLKETVKVLEDDRNEALKKEKKRQDEIEEKMAADAEKAKEEDLNRRLEHLVAKKIAELTEMEETIEEETTAKPTDNPEKTFSWFNWFFK